MAYTYTTFRTYLQDEILQDTARLMGWIDSPGPDYALVGTTNYPTSITGSRNAQPAYDSITNEVLLQMGYSTPESVPDADLLEMRALGRIEAWRAVAYNTMGDVDMNLGDSTVLRSQVFTTALNQMDLAEIDYKQRFGTPTVQVGTARAATYAVENEWRF